HGGREGRRTRLPRAGPRRLTRASPHGQRFEPARGAGPRTGRNLGRGSYLTSAGCRPCTTTAVHCANHRAWLAWTVSDDSEGASTPSSSTANSTNSAGRDASLSTG